jgi:proline dehydrogenase
MFGRTLILKTSSLPPVERLVRKSFLFRPVVKRFIAGDTLEEAMEAGVALLRRGFTVSLDYLGENTSTPDEAKEAKCTYVRMLEEISSRLERLKGEAGALPRCEHEPLNISIKLTQCGLDMGDEFAEQHYREVLRVAKDHGNFVRVDMESSAYTQRTLDIVERVWKDFQNTGTVLQSYLHRTDEDVEAVIRLGARVRLVKGAYLEPESVAYQAKSKVDEQYVKQAKRLMEAANYPAIATQDEAIIRTLNAYAKEQGIDKSRFEYQMLYGIRRDLQEGLLEQGYNVRVYVPFGDSWYPYFTRRLAERPANTLFILKSMFRG